MDTKGLQALLAVAVVAALAPAIAAALPKQRIPQIVIMILSGILIGPSVLGLANTASLTLLSNVGLGFLFLLAGYELDPALLRERAGRLAIAGWCISAVIAVGAVGGLTAAGFVRDYVPIGLALTTTALGTLLPILKDNDMLTGHFGRYVLAAGAVGEVFPILAIALVLTRRREFITTASIALICGAALLLAVAPRFLGENRLRALISQGQRATAQTTLRWSFVLLLALLVLAARFGLDVVLGAVIAGVVLRSWSRRMGVDITPLEQKLDAVGYGVFIPIFFVVSGMKLAVGAIIDNPLRLVVFLVLLLVVRGLPALFVYRKVLPARQRVEMTFITATTMPLLIALAEIGLSDGVMLKANAAALVGAGVLSVLIYPLIAVALARRRRGSDAEPSAETAPDPDTGLASLPQARNSLAHANAHSRGSPAAPAPAQLLQQRCRDACARTAERVPDRNRAAIDVHEVLVQLELIHNGYGLSREGLVDLDQRQFTALPPGPVQCLGHGRDGPDAHVVRVHSGRGRARVPGERVRPDCRQRTLRHQQKPGRTVVQRRGVAAGDRAALAKRRPLGREFLRCQVSPDAFIGHYLAGRCLDRHKLSVKPPGCGSCRGALVTMQGELVLPGPVHPVFVRDVLSCLAQADWRVHLGHLRADQAPAEPGIDEAGVSREDFARPRQDERGTGHRLGATCDADIGVSCRDGARGRADRLHPGTTQPVHGRSWHVDRQARQQYPHARDVPVVFTGLVGRAPIDIVNGPRVEPRIACQQRRDHVSGQVVWPHAGQRAFDLADRRPAGVDGEYS